MKRLPSMLSDYSSLSTATTYTKDYLMHGTSCDSSKRASDRMSYISKALMCEDIKQVVLKRASELCLRDIERQIEEQRGEIVTAEEVLKDILKETKNEKP